jgi:hypothetical protein
MVLRQIAAGRYLLNPFTILATWFHEMGRRTKVLAFNRG